MKKFIRGRGPKNNSTFTTKGKWSNFFVILYKWQRERFLCTCLEICTELYGTSRVFQHQCLSPKDKTLFWHNLMFCEVMFVLGMHRRKFAQKNKLLGVTVLKWNNKQFEILWVMVEWHWKGPHCLTVLKKNVRVHASSYHVLFHWRGVFVLLLVIMLCELIKLREKVELKTFVTCTVHL